MMPLITEAQLIDEIGCWLKTHLSVTVQSGNRIRRGLMNEKWIVETDKGRLFVKCYHPERYKERWQNTEFRAGFEDALQLQLLFYQSGGRCPEPLALDGRCMHLLPCGRYMAVMTCCPGMMVPAGQMGERRMYALGRAAADMHTVWDSAAVTGVGVAIPRKEPAYRLSRERMEQTWETNWDAARGSAGHIRNALQLQKAIIDSLRQDDLAPPAPGWAHLDLWADNLLFEGDALTAIVDFDRARYSFPAMDLGRAVLSGTLSGGGFQRDAVAAFAEGYCSRRPLPPGSLVQAVKYVWCVETFWWIQPSMETSSVVPVRFAEEMMVTARNWEQLDALLEGS
ncbi:phosphotransferase [Paenibacillus mesotrionivorans]|uniref:Phosphotransferase n=1 Tax=Paenibacillus mesotrionivorans TaxID=3160968 RepID=A0ACC7P5D1_9BACL